MKKINILKAAIAILAGASLFTLVSCDNLNQLSEKESAKAYLRVTLSDEARTVLPYSGVTEFTNFKLSYNDTDPDTGNSILTAIGTTYASYSAFEKAEIELPKELIGKSKTFTLEAEKGAIKFAATYYKSSISYGENNVSFLLKPVSLGSGKGGFNYTFDFSKAKNARDVVSAKVIIKKLTGGTSTLETLYLESSEITGNKIVVAKDQLEVPENDEEADPEYPYAAGSYQIDVTLYADESYNCPLIIWSDYIQIAEGLVSKGGAEVSSLYGSYTISFEANGGNAVSPLKVSSISTSLPLPTATKAGNLFVGWYEDSALTIPFVFSTDSVTADKTLYAKYISEKNTDGSYNATASSLYSFLYGIGTNTEATVGTQSNPVTVKIVGVYNLSVVKNALSNNSTVYVNLDLSQAENVTSLNNAFYNRSNLTGVILPASCTSVDADTFYSCSNLSSITVDSANTTYKSVNGVLYSKDGTVLVKYPAKKTGTSFAIPAGVKVINTYAFQGTSNITSISLPGSSYKLYYSSNLITSDIDIVNLNAYDSTSTTYDLTAYIQNYTSSYYFYPSNKTFDDFITAVSVYDSNNTVVNEQNYTVTEFTPTTQTKWYKITTEANKTYKVSWCDSNSNPGTNNISNCVDSKIFIYSSPTATVALAEKDDGESFEFTATGTTTYILVRPYNSGDTGKCAFRVWAQASSGSGE